MSYSFLISTIFIIGFVGFILQKDNIIMMLICTEIMLLASCSNFILGSVIHNDVSGFIFVLFCLTIGAAESSFGLALILKLGRKNNTVSVNLTKK